jgi:hypothetical protein
MLKEYSPETIEELKWCDDTALHQYTGYDRRRRP